LGDHIKTQRTARLKELERQAKAAHIQEQENDDKDKRDSSSGDRPSQDTIAQSSPGRVQVDPPPTNQSTEAPELFVVDLRSGDPKTYQLSPICKYCNTLFSWFYNSLFFLIQYFNFLFLKLLTSLNEGSQRPNNGSQLATTLIGLNLNISCLSSWR